MLAQDFKTSAGKFSDDPLMIEKFWNEITKAYSSGGRHYHTMVHLESMHLVLQNVKDKIQRWDQFIFALAYHDFIYKPLSHSNEEKSAGEAQARLEKLQIPPDEMQQVKELILSTKKHEQSQDANVNFFIDADLSILGMEPGTYAVYARNVRKEYWLVPDRLYKPGRKAVLEHFLRMPFIFKSGDFREKFEDCARNNIENELTSIS